jgi:hypothetical protein
MITAYVILVIALLMVAGWCWAFRDEIRNLWMDWQLDREFRKRHREKSR